MAGGTFEVLEGQHEEGAGTGKQIYRKGDKVESKLDLDKLFANKFKRLGGPNLRQRDRDDSLDSSGRVMDDELSEKRAKTKKKTSQEEMTVEEVKEERKARGAHAKNEAGSRRRGETPEEDQADQEENEPVEEAEETEEKDYGEEVTEQFSKAVDKGWTVHKNEEGVFTVADPDRDEPLKSDLASKKEVNDFLRGPKKTKKAKKSDK